MWNISLRSMWNEICPRSRSEHFTFAKQIFHREAISLARKGKFRWGTCFIAGTPWSRGRSTSRKAWMWFAFPPQSASSWHESIKARNIDTKCQNPLILKKEAPIGAPAIKQVRQRNLPFRASEIASRWNICFANVKCSLRERGQISFHIEQGEIFHNMRQHIISRFAIAKHFTYIYRPTIRFYKCNTLYLSGQGVWKGVRTNRPYPFFFFGR